MSALPWKRLAERLRYDRENAIAERAVRLAQLGDAEQSNAILLDELTVANAAHRELAIEYDAKCAELNASVAANGKLAAAYVKLINAEHGIRDQLRAVQSELSYRATHGPELARNARDEADARWIAARDRLRAAEREVERARWDEDDARQDADEAHRAVVSGRGEVAA